MKILAIETSCDETACAVVEDGVKILSNVVASSAQMHEKYGGIVPEVAAREQLKCVMPVITEAIKPLKKSVSVSVCQCVSDYIDAVAVTVGPGLIGSLLIGVETAKTIAFVCNKPIIPVNHVLAHMYANFLDHEPITNNYKLIKFPAISLVVSGGHTELYFMKSIKDLQWLGGTLDDAAGECFDKTARLLGFGSRGGVAIQEAAQTHHVSHVTYHVKLPRPMIDDGSLNFSFSGLKTAVIREIASSRLDLRKPQGLTSELTTAFAYEIQEAITDVLVEKTLRAAKQFGAKSIILSGGVAANLRLREKFQFAIRQFDNLKIIIPLVSLCTDNSAYIGAYAFFRGNPACWQKITAVPDLSVEKI